jgi:hypothetical protein
MNVFSALFTGFSLLALVWLGLASIVGFAAHARGRSFVAWTALALVFTPILSGIAVLVMAKDTNELEDRGIRARELRRCPACRGVSRYDATACMHCGRALEGDVGQAGDRVVSVSVRSGSVDPEILAPGVVEPAGRI